MARFISEAAKSAHRAHQAVASCAVSLPAHPAHCHQPNWAVKRTPTRAMASPLSWPLLVPFSRCAPSGAAYLGLQGLPHLSSKTIPG